MSAVTCGADSPAAAAAQLPPPRQLRSLSAGMPREAQLMFVSCTDERSPSCPGVCWSPSRGCCGLQLNHLVPQPSLTSTPFSSALQLGSSVAFPHWTLALRWPLQPWIPLLQTLKPLLHTYKVSSETNSREIRTFPSCQLHIKQKNPTTVIKNARTPTPMNLISLPFTSLSPVSISGVSRGGAS